MKNQLKRYASLLMAVIMLLSCWVWVAPEKAEAAALNAYTIRVYHTVGNANDGGATLTARYKTNHGYGSQTTKEFTLSGAQDGTEAAYTDMTLPNGCFPDQFAITMRGAFSTKTDVRVTKITVNGYTVADLDVDGSGFTFDVGWSGSQTLTVTRTGDYSYTANSNTVNANTSNNSQTSWTMPTPGSITPPTSVEVELDKLPRDSTFTNTVTYEQPVDQYGVTWDSHNNGTWSHKITSDATGNTVFNNANLKYSGNTYQPTITAKTALQTVNKNVASSTYYLMSTWSWNGKSVNTNTTLKYYHPEYSITFDANGGHVYDEATGQNAERTVIGGADSKFYYGSPIKGAPKADALNKANKYFVNFYTTQEGDVVGKNIPNDYINGAKVFKDGVTEIVQDQTFYAIWHSNPVIATFYTQDNQYLGTVEGRYDNYLTNTNMYDGLTNLNAAVMAAYEAEKAAENSTVNKDIKFDASNAPVFKDKGAVLTFEGWQIIAGPDDVMDKDEDTILKSDVTFIAKYRSPNAEQYTVTFEDGNGGNASTPKTDYYYRDLVTNVPANAPTKAQDNYYTYEFAGWKEKLADTKFYTVDQDGKDENGVTLSYTSKDAAEFTVKKSVTYVPVFKTTDRLYSVNFNYAVDGGGRATTETEYYKYGEKIIVPAIVPDSYTRGPMRYPLESYNHTSPAGEVLDFETFTVNGNITVFVVYSSVGEATKFHVDFYGKDDRETPVVTNEVEYQTQIRTLLPSVGGNNDPESPEYYVTLGHDFPETIDTAEKLYTFAQWVDVNGNALVAKPVTKDEKFYAQYNEKTYAKVTYYNYDGTLLETHPAEGATPIFVGDPLPAYVGTQEAPVPTRAEDVRATYEFSGWSETYSGSVAENEITSADMKLYATYKENLKEYTVKFFDEDGDLLDEKKYNYGVEITMPADPTKAADETFTYTFRNWSPDVSKVCYGDAEYTANYKKTYIYHGVTWAKDNGRVHNASNYIYGERIHQAGAPESTIFGAAPAGYTWAIEDWYYVDLVWMQEYFYGGVIPEDLTQMPEENEALFTYRKAKIKALTEDADAKKFVRGDKMDTSDIYLFPVYYQKANAYTVTFYDEDGTTELGKATVAHNAKFADIEAKSIPDAVKKANTTHHFLFKNWKIKDGAELTAEYAAEYVFTGNVSLVAVYNPEAHNKQIFEVVKEPTCMEGGLVNKKCKTDACGLIDENVAVDPIPDTNAPTGEIYVGSNIWKSTDGKKWDNAANYEDVVYVGSKSQFIITAKDKGTPDAEDAEYPWNPDGLKNRQVGTISYYVHKVTYDENGAAQLLGNPADLLNGWREVYNYQSVYGNVFEGALTSAGLTLEQYDALAKDNAKKIEIDTFVRDTMASYSANATSTLGAMSQLTNANNGDRYIVYVKVTDRVLNKVCNAEYFTSGVFEYSKEVPEFTVTNEKGAATNVICKEATITLTEKQYNDAAVILLNGKDIKRNFLVGEGNIYTYNVDVATIHTVAVTNKFGNTASATFEIIGNHSYVNYTIGASCESEGSRYDLCSVCGDKTNETVILATGHSYNKDKYIEVAANCLADGYRKYTCFNGCGTTVEVRCLDFDDVNYVCPVEGLTLADIAHLATVGAHTYEKATDADGQETAEDAWIIDKDATCKATGLRHKDCTVCGETVAETIAIVPDAHKFYRAVADKNDPATCTEPGSKIEICRYCGYENKLVDVIPALGHTVPDEYKIDTYSSCTVDGLKVKYCAVESCKERLDGKVNGVAVAEDVEINTEEVIKAVGHDWELSEATKDKPRQDEATGKWYLDYECTVCDETKSEETTHEDIKPATLTFINEEDGGQAMINSHVGGTVIATDIVDPVAQSTLTYNYIFSHWETRDAAGKGTPVTFPITVKEESATYYAVFTQKYVNYSITYYREGGTEQFRKVGYLHNNETYDLIEGPAKSETATATYEFAGWKLITTNNDGKVDEDGKVTIEGKDLMFEATYTAIPKEYTVAYVANDDVILVKVKAGAAATYPIGVDGVTEPVKEADYNYHYEFNGWNKADQLKEVYSNIYTAPVFKEIEHELKTRPLDPAKPATCTDAEVLEVYCTGCDYTSTIEGAPALGHIWGDVVVGEDGTTSQSCIRNCGATNDGVADYKVTFMNGDDIYKTKNYVKHGTALKDIVPSDPTKHETATHSYEFIGWATTATATTPDVDVEKVTVKADVVYYAVYKQTVRKYTVVFAYDAKNPIQTIKDVPAGSDVAFDLATYGTPTKAHDKNNHYTFDGWSQKTTNVTENLYVIAEFKSAAHDYVENGKVPATCEVGESIEMKCKVCDRTYTKNETSDPLGHDLIVETRVEATPGENGYIRYVCQREGCDHTENEELVWLDTNVTITVRVLKNGQPQANVKVEIQNKATSEAVTYKSTNADGYVTFDLSEGEYNAYAFIDGEGKFVELKSSGERKLSGEYSYESKACSCACHRDNIWGSIFRFFHKIIKLFMGEFKCCNDPDPRYN